jgi:hypothetical protein
MTEETMQIEERVEHHRKAESPIVESFEPDSKVTVERDWHPEKHCRQSISTEAGMQTDARDLQIKKAESSIIARFEPDSNDSIVRD